jgi:hypothetical protein
MLDDRKISCPRLFKRVIEVSRNKQNEKGVPFRDTPEATAENNPCEALCRI